MQQISDDYNALFVGEECRVSPYRSAWQEGATEAEVRAFLSERGMPLTDMPADHIGTLLLAASWIEDHASDDENEAIETLFEEYLLPWCGTFLGKVEAHAISPFWRTLAPLTRDAIAAMWDELEEEIEGDLGHINSATAHFNLHNVLLISFLWRASAKMRAMNILLCIALTTGILSGLWGWVAVSLGLLSWAGFLGCTAYFACPQGGVKGCLSLAVR
jgi:hypothetical protein